jgi:hypothetical protein
MKRSRSKKATTSLIQQLNLDKANVISALQNWSSICNPQPLETPCPHCNGTGKVRLYSLTAATHFAVQPQGIQKNNTRLKGKSNPIVGFKRDYLKESRDILIKSMKDFEHMRELDRWSTTKANPPPSNPLVPNPLAPNPLAPDPLLRKRFR